MKNSVLCGQQWCCYLTVTFFCFNLILGIGIYSTNGYFKWGQSIQNSSLYIREVVSTQVAGNGLIESLAKQILPSSPTLLHGYVLPYKIYEQQTSAARNLWGLQFWANTVGMKVVEPFYAEHTLSFKSIIAGESTNVMKFSDLYNIDYWNKQSMERNCSELISWESFISNAPRNVILVFTRGYKPNSKNVANGGMLKINENPDAIVGIRNCGNIEFPEAALTYFKQNRFHFVREVCITFNASTPLTFEEYSHHILGQFSSNQVTVIFALWPGIRNNRVNLKGVKITNANSVLIGLLPSKTIVQESKRYLQNLNLTGKYFGVMVRIEKVLISFVTLKGQGSFDEFVNYMLECASDLKQLKEFDKHKNWKRTLAIDLGKFGSIMKQHDKKFIHGINELYVAYFSSIFGDNSWSIKEYESSFIKYLGTDNPVHIAQVQRTVAALSDCLIVVGGKSTFQSVAISFYKNFHPNVEQQCIIEHCYDGYDFDFNAFVQKIREPDNDR